MLCPAPRCWVQSTAAAPAYSACSSRHSNSAIGQGDAAGQARPQHRALRVEQAAFHVGTRHRGGGAGTTQCDQFVGQQVLQALAAGCEEFQSDLIGLLRSSRPAPERRQRLASNCANAAALACTWPDRRCESSTSSRRALRAAAQSTTCTAGISSSCQPWMDRGRHRGCLQRRGAAHRDRRRHQEQACLSTCSDTCPEIHAPRLEPASTSGRLPLAACFARSTRRCSRAATSPSSLTSRLASRSV